MQTVHPQQAVSPLENLLVRYMNGQIADQSWDRMMETFDHEGVTTFERLAYARFMNELISDAGPERLHVPMPKEMEELLVEVRV